MAYAVRMQNLDLPGRHVASRRVSLEVRFGEAVGIVGRAGTGKSLLLRILSGQRPGHAVTLEVLGLDVQRQPRRVWESVGFVSDALDSILDWRSAAENLWMEATQKGLPAARIAEAVHLQLERHGLVQRAGTVAAQLDREARFRLGLAQAAVARPRLLLLDDPFPGGHAETSAHLAAPLQEWLAEDASHTLIAAGQELGAFGKILTGSWRLDERGLVPLPLAALSEGTR